MAVLATLTLSMCGTALRAHAVVQDAAAAAVHFDIHGARKTCGDITELDSALTWGSQEFFAGWSEQDYALAAQWSKACREYGWQTPGRPRLSLLDAQRERALPRESQATRQSGVPVRSGIPRAATDDRAIPAAVLRRTLALANSPDPLRTDERYGLHFHQESLWVAAKANLDIGGDPGPSGWPSDGTALHLKNRLTADRIVLYCAHRSPEVHALLWDWRRCEADEAAAYKRLVSDNEFPAAGRGALLACAGLDSYLLLERCIESLAGSGAQPDSLDVR